MQISKIKNLQKNIFEELINLLYANGLGPISGSLVLSLLLGWILLESLPIFAPIWMLASIILFTIRVILYVTVQNRKNTLSDKTRAWIFTLGSWLSGILWGVGGWFIFDPTNEFNTMMIMILLNGIASGVVISLSPFPPAYLGYMVLSIFPVMIKMILIGGMENHILLAIEIFSFILLIGWHKNTYQTFYKSIKLQFENNALIESIRKESELTKQAQLEAERSNQEKSTFIAAASHDLRQPLFAMQLNLIKLQKTETQSSHSQEIVNSLNRDIESLTEMFNGLLDVSKFDSGMMKPVIQYVDIDELKNSIINEFTAKFSNRIKDIHIRSSLKNLQTDPVYLHRIFTNLIGNSLKFSKKKILVTIKKKHEMVEIKIYDQGIGISQEHQVNIFKEYYQVNNPSRNRQHGFGMGLSIVKRLINQLNGTITVNSTLGMGTVFCIKLPHLRPVKKSFTPPQRDIITNHSPDELTIDIEKIKLLLVDDDENILEPLEIIFADHGLQVYCANTYQSAIHCINKNSYDLILSDYRLNDSYTGTQVIRHAREKDPSIIGIILTGDTGVDKITDIQNTGAHLFHKPVQVNRLLDIIYSELKQRTL